MFNAEREVRRVVDWIRNYLFESRGESIVLGISGGLDSAVTLKLCIAAIGKENVHALHLCDSLVPSRYAKELEKNCEIEAKLIDISGAIWSLKEELLWIFETGSLTDVTRINLPVRIRMTALYAYAGMFDGCRVANTCNLSESYVGYDTKWGDSAGDFAPLAAFTKTEVREMGKILGVPQSILERAPEDGLCGKSDEESFGFTYGELDNFLRNAGRIEKGAFVKIKKMHECAQHKLKSIKLPHYEYNHR